MIKYLKYVGITIKYFKVKLKWFYYVIKIRYLFNFLDNIDYIMYCNNYNFIVL